MCDEQRDPASVARTSASHLNRQPRVLKVTKDGTDKTGHNVSWTLFCYHSPLPPGTLWTRPYFVCTPDALTVNARRSEETWRRWRRSTSACTRSCCSGSSAYSRQKYGSVYVCSFALSLHVYTRSLTHSLLFQLCVSVCSEPPAHGSAALRGRVAPAAALLSTTWELRRRHSRRLLGAILPSAICCYTLQEQ